MAPAGLHITQMQLLQRGIYLHALWNKYKQIEILNRIAPAQKKHRVKQTHLHFYICMHSPAFLAAILAQFSALLLKTSS